MGSSSSTLRRRRRVTLRCEPRGPPPPRAGPPERLAFAGAPPVGAPGRVAENPPPGREGPPVRGAPVLGRALMGRGPLEGPLRAPGAERGRRTPGGGGMGRPVELMGRPGGGGMGRPVELSGGRFDPSPSAAPPRWVGRIVVGPSGEAVRIGAGLGGTTRDRTTLAAGGATTSGVGAAAAGATVSVAPFIGATGATARVTRTGASRGGGAGASGAADFVVLVATAAFSALSASAGTARRSPSASARRRMRSACASSMDADGLDAPIPSFWASASNSLLVRPSSLESSCTRIFFGAKTFLLVRARTFAGHSFLFFHNYSLLLAASARSVETSPSCTAVRRARARCPTRRSCSHAPSRHHHTPRPSPRPRNHVPETRPARTISVSARR